MATFDFSPFAILTFDCYGTLIDWESGILRTVMPWLEAGGYRGGNEEILAAFAGAEAMEELRAPEKPYPQILEAAYGRMAVALGILPERTHAKAFGASVGSWPTFPDTHDALQRLHRRFKLGILSNVDHDSFAATQSKLGVTFDLVVTAADVGSYKPNLQNFKTLLARLGEMNIAAPQVLHVAQSLYHDHVPAQKLGLTTCWIDRRGGRGGGATLEAGGVTPHVTFASLRALADAAGA